MRILPSGRGARITAGVSASIAMVCAVVLAEIHQKADPPSR